MRAKIFQPFQKVWTPRTPDSGYDSYGIVPLPPAIVATAPPADAIDTSLTLASGAYFAATRISGAVEAIDCSLKLASGTYTA